MANLHASAAAGRNSDSVLSSCAFSVQVIDHNVGLNMSALVEHLCFPSLKERSQSSTFMWPSRNFHCHVAPLKQYAVCITSLMQNDCSVAPQAKNSLYVCQSDDSKI